MFFRQYLPKLFFPAQIVADEEIFGPSRVTSALEEMKSWSKLSRSKSNEDLVVLVQ
jgi:hypothetical protein